VWTPPDADAGSAHDERCAGERNDPGEGNEVAMSGEPGERDGPGGAGQDHPPLLPGKYARVERERRFLLAAPPEPATVTAVRTLTDRCLTGTRLRLRRTEHPDGSREFTLTQKVPVARPGAVRGLLTNTYLSPAEYDLLATLPAAVLSKTRLSVPPLGVDVFDGQLRGLVLAEAEFTTDEEARAFLPPPQCVAEVTDDARFTGGRLAVTPRRALLRWPAEYGCSGEG
jgi:CYTH domain-containing protein